LGNQLLQMPQPHSTQRFKNGSDDTESNFCQGLLRLPCHSPFKYHWLKSNSTGDVLIGEPRFTLFTFSLASNRESACFNSVLDRMMGSSEEAEYSDCIWNQFKMNICVNRYIIEQWPIMIIQFQQSSRHFSSSKVLKPGYQAISLLKPII
jgi:hypothetical protein